MEEGEGLSLGVLAAHSSASMRAHDSGGSEGGGVWRWPRCDPTGAQHLSAWCVRALRQVVGTAAATNGTWAAIARL
jgi:hypothetical protein